MNVNKKEKIGKQYSINLSSPDEKRIQYLRNGSLFVMHRQIAEIFERLDHLRLEKGIGTRSMTIIGDSGMGKTALAEAYVHTRGLEPICKADFIERPAAIVHMPATSGLSAFFERILQSYKYPHPEHGTIAQKQARVFKVLKEAKTEILFLDDIDNLFIRGKDRTKNFILSTLKDTANGSEIPLVLMGSNNTLDILQTNVEVMRRFSMVKLEPFDCVTQDFKGFLDLFVENLPLKEPSKLSSNEEVVTEIIVYTKGIVSEISALLRSSAIAAIQSGSEKIGLGEISFAKNMLSNR